MRDDPVHDSGALAAIPRHDFKRLLRRIVDAYDSPLIRGYSKVRFTIININILHILALCIRERRRVLDLGCGFGLFGCYFSAIYPDIVYHGYDLNAERVAMANRAARRLGLTNATFFQGDARTLQPEGEFDAILMIDLMHHLEDSVKHKLLDVCALHLAPGGRLILKEITTHPPHELAFTWALDALMTRSFDMWYWGEEQFHATLRRHFERVDILPIADWLPYPHVVYLGEGLRPRPRESGAAPA